MKLRQVILLRHGETDWNAGMRMQGHRDVPLNEAGRRQARAAAPSVAALGPQLIMSSDLSRARDTAAEVAALTGLPVQADERLRETSLGLWEGLTPDEAMAGWPAEWDAWRADSAHQGPPGGESRAQVAQRSAPVVADLESAGVERALLVAHGGLIIGLTGHLLGMPAASWGALIGVGNCHWVVLDRHHEGWRLRSYNAGLSGVVFSLAEDDAEG